MRNTKPRLALLLITVAGACTFLIRMGIVMKKPMNEIKIAFDGAWQSTHPGLQHTLIGDLTLSNQFEPLVGINENGAYVHLAATEWTISPNFKLLKPDIN